MKTLNRHLGRYISIFYRKGAAFITKRLSDFGIGKGHHILLKSLAKRDGISQEQIATILHVNKSTAARAVSKLENLGYVKREQSSIDKRILNVFLTTEGRMLQNDINKVLDDWGDIIFKDFNEHEKIMLENMFIKITKNISIHLGDEKCDCIKDILRED